MPYACTTDIRTATHCELVNASRPDVQHQTESSPCAVIADEGNLHRG